MNEVFLLIGGNEGDRFRNLEAAREHINLDCGAIVSESSIYETAAWGNTHQASFLNQALVIDTDHDAETLMQTILQIEETLGRRRNVKYGPRIIDIDILFFGNAVIDLPNLKIPHTEIQNRRFALAPLFEIAPKWIHPVLNKTVEELLASCTDPLDVKKL